MILAAVVVAVFAHGQLLDGLSDDLMGPVEEMRKAQERKARVAWLVRQGLCSPIPIDLLVQQGQ